MHSCTFDVSHHLAISLQKIFFSSLGPDTICSLKQDILLSNMESRFDNSTITLVLHPDLISVSTSNSDLRYKSNLIRCDRSVDFSGLRDMSLRVVREGYTNSKKVYSIPHKNLETTTMISEMFIKLKQIRTHGWKIQPALIGVRVSADSPSCEIMKPTFYKPLNHTLKLSVIQSGSMLFTSRECSKFPRWFASQLLDLTPVRYTCSKSAVLPPLRSLFRHNLSQNIGFLGLSNLTKTLKL